MLSVLKSYTEKLKRESEMERTITKMWTHVEALQSNQVERLS